MAMKSVWPGGKSPLSRFFEKIRKDPETCCWLWESQVNGSGYGIFYSHGRQWRAHRWSYMMFVGDPGELCVCHACDVPCCVNPKHLWLGTKADNHRDAVKKGRIDHTGDLSPSRIYLDRLPRGDSHWSRREIWRVRRGESGTSAKLTWASVRKIREKYAAGGVTYRQLAQEFGVSFAVIGDVVRRETWVDTGKSISSS